MMCADKEWVFMISLMDFYYLSMLMHYRALITPSMALTTNLRNTTIVVTVTAVIDSH